MQCKTVEAAVKQTLSEVTHAQCESSLNPVTELSSRRSLAVSFHFIQSRPAVSECELSVVKEWQKSVNKINSKKQKHSEESADGSG